MDYMLADVWARYQRQNGREVRFQTGVDEHGNKIAAKAASQNQTPQAYVDQMHGNFQNMIAELNISATDFIRTTDPNGPYMSCKKTYFIIPVYLALSTVLFFIFFFFTFGFQYFFQVSDT